MCDALLFIHFSFSESVYGHADIIWSPDS